MAYEGYGRRDWRGEHDDRGFLDRAGDEVRSWFGDEEAERRRRQDERDYERNRTYDPGRGGYGSYGRGPRGESDYERGVSGAYGGFGTASGYGPYTGGTYLEGSSRGLRDRHYSEWRRREIAALDRDYDDYCREHQQRFDSEFGSWRSNRLSQRESLERVRAHQDVVGSDGAHLGKVDHVRGDRIILTRSDPEAGGHHHSIPCSWVASVGERVELNCTADRAKEAWRDEEGRGALSGDQQERIGKTRSPQSVRP